MAGSEAHYPFMIICHCCSIDWPVVDYCYGRLLDVIVRPSLTVYRSIGKRKQLYCQE